MDKVIIYKVIDGKVRQGGPMDRSSYEAVWKEKGWRLSPPKEKKEETE
jgi:hypothetical protein